MCVVYFLNNTFLLHWNELEGSCLCSVGAGEPVETRWREQDPEQSQAQRRTENMAVSDNTEKACRICVAFRN